MAQAALRTLAEKTGAGTGQAPGAAAVAPASSGAAADIMQEALLHLIGKPVRKWVHVDVQEKLEKLGLKEHFPVEVLPPTNAMRKLATAVKTRSEKGEKNPLIFVNLKVCLL